MASPWMLKVLRTSSGRGQAWAAGAAGSGDWASVGQRWEKSLYISHKATLQKYSTTSKDPALYTKISQQKKNSLHLLSCYFYYRKVGGSTGVHLLNYCVLVPHF